MNCKASLAYGDTGGLGIKVGKMVPSAAKAIQRERIADKLFSTRLPLLSYGRDAETPRAARQREEKE